MILQSLLRLKERGASCRMPWERQRFHSQRLQGQRGYTAHGLLPHFLAPPTAHGFSSFSTPGLKTFSYCDVSIQIPPFRSHGHTMSMDTEKDTCIRLFHSI